MGNAIDISKINRQKDKSVTEAQNEALKTETDFN